MEDSRQTFPAEGLEHFERHFQNITSLAERSPGEFAIWDSIFQFGNELRHSLAQEKVTPDEAEELKAKIKTFMSQGANRQNYEEYMEECNKDDKEDPAIFWWEEDSKGDASQKTP